MSIKALAAIFTCVFSLCVVLVPSPTPAAGQTVGEGDLDPAGNQVGVSLTAEEANFGTTVNPSVPG